jgi:hypothetical protein
MTTQCTDCSEITDSAKLVREGSHRDVRQLRALDPAHVPVDERRQEHAIVFASAFSTFLKYFDLNNVEDGDWQKFFASDVSAQLAALAIEDVDGYRTTVKELLGKLEDPELPASGPEMVATLGAVFDCLGTLASRLDALLVKMGLPADHPLRTTLSNLVRSQLSPSFQSLIGYYKAGDTRGVVNTAATPAAGLLILGGPLTSFNDLITGDGLKAPAWPEGVGKTTWTEYSTVNAQKYQGAYGPSTGTVVEQVNHLATHNLFTAICETFLAIYARVVAEASAALEETFDWDGHEPHYSLFLSFLRLFDHARAETNKLTSNHLDFYYRKVLELQERPATPGQAHVLVELAKHSDVHPVDEGTLLKAGKDDTGADAHFSVTRDLVANKAVVSETRRLYRHPPSEPLPIDHDRIFATATAQETQSWHPFAEKTFTDGALTEIAMPTAEVGFGVASHYLWLAEGTRAISVAIETTKKVGGSAKQLPVDLLCRLTTEDGWLEKPISQADVSPVGFGFLLALDGNDPPITPYDPEVHGYGFATPLPMLLVTLRHRTDHQWDYAALADLRFKSFTLTVSVTGMRTLALSNDHGPIDPAKPYLAFGSVPIAGSSLVIGSKEVFQKAPSNVTLNLDFMATPRAYSEDFSEPSMSADYLDGAKWELLNDAFDVDHGAYGLDPIPQPAVVNPDLTPDAPFATTSRAGFVRLRLNSGYGTDTYPVALAGWIAGDREDAAPLPPVLPMIDTLTLDYSATQEIDLETPSEGDGRFFHLTPFGHAEQARTSQTGITLLPQFLAGSNEPAEGELYLGVTELEPPQDLALLFQVDEGTANPLTVKPEDHLRWTYLRGNEWVPFPQDAVADGTDGLLASGIVTLSVPADATTEHTLLPSGKHWIRIGVATNSDAVCRQVRVVAQALRATYVMRDNGSTSHTKELPAGTITKLDTPDAAVKGVTQPFPTFGGRPVETQVAFATRVSERLRHKDRAIALWDYEHLVLEAFPAIYQARCLNHTRYEPNTTGTGIYRELAPGHVTVVTIPDLAVPNPRDPLRPFTSLRVLGEIERFLSARTSCFTKLHVRNPQFEEVRVGLRVRFRDGVDETFHVNLLKREMTELLSPWAFRSDARPTFNGKIYKSVLVDFVEDRPYVDYVTDVHLFHRLPGVSSDGPDLEEVHGSRAISILVSVPAEQHGVTVIHPDESHVHEHCACSPLVEVSG